MEGLKTSDLSSQLVSSEGDLKGVVPADFLSRHSACCGILNSELFIFFRKSHLSRLLRLELDCLSVLIVEGNFTGSEDWGLNEHEVGIVGETTEKPDERLFELVVALGRDVIVLEVLLSVESDLLGFHFAVLHIDLVAYEYNWDVLANSGEILVPLGDVGVSDAGANVEHDDAAVSTNIVTISEAT